MTTVREVFRTTVLGIDGEALFAALGIDPDLDLDKFRLVAVPRTPCETCEGHGVFPHRTDDGWVDDCPDCDGTGEAKSLAERHMRHYQSCNCLGNSSECCVASCECHGTGEAKVVVLTGLLAEKTLDDAPPMLLGGIARWAWAVGWNACRSAYLDGTSPTHGGAA